MMVVMVVMVVLLTRIMTEMWNLTDVMPAGCPDSETLRSRDCVTGDSFSILFSKTIKMRTIKKKNLRSFFTSSFVRLRLIAECGTKAPGVLNG